MTIIIERTTFRDKKTELIQKRKCKMLREAEFARKNSVSVARFLNISENRFENRGGIANELEIQSRTFDFS